MNKSAKFKIYNIMKNTYFCILGTISFCCMSFSIQAQDLGVKAPAQKKAIALVGGTVHPVNSDSIENGYVLFDDGKIKEVGSGKSKKDFHVSVDVIDVSDHHVYPGLIHPFTQLGLKEISSLSDPTDVNEYGSETPEVRATVAVNPDSTVIPVSRSNGILLAGVFPSGGTIPGRAGVIRLDGWTTEDMTVTNSSGLVVSWPNMSVISASWMKDSPKKQRENANKRIKEITQFLDDALDYYQALGAGIQESKNIQFDAIRNIFPKKQGDAPKEKFFVLAQKFDQIVSAIQISQKYGLDLVIVGGYESHLCMPLLKEHNVGVIVINTNRLPRRADSDYDEAWKLPSILESNGVNWCLAQQKMFGNERNLPYNAGAAVGFGLSHEKAVRSITLGAAEVLGIDNHYGSIEPGKSATVIVTTDSPLEILCDIEMAFIDGRQIDLDNKQTILRDKYETKYKQIGQYPLEGVAK